MSEQLTPKYPALLASDVTPDWIERVRSCMSDPRAQIRVRGRCIETRYSDSTVGWQPTMLQTGGIYFDNEKEAQAVYNQITGA